jgi:aminoglycoside 6-adenylyltransferase
MLDQILRWAEKKQSVRTLILVGSRANPAKQDERSDYDISIFGEDFDFIEKDEWLTDIFPPLLCIHEKFFWGDTCIPTRLTIFENLIKVDFAFHASALLEEMVKHQHLTATYDAGYQVLLDKDGLANGLPGPTFRAYTKEKPNRYDFDNAVREFWFEAYHVGKYIARKDLWVAQVRMQDMRKWLLAIFEWNVAAKADFLLRMNTDGKAMNDWIPPAFKKEIKKCFAGLDLAAQRLALHETIGLFGVVARETARMLQYDYPEKVDHEITAFISQLIASSYDSTKVNNL